MISAKAIGADLVSRDLLKAAGEAHTRSQALERHYRGALLTDIQARAPKRTGAYASSWRVDGNEVGTDAPQAHRLEAGFHGVDSLGRRYNNPPQPHVDPAVEDVEGQFVVANEAMVRSL